MTLRVVSDGLGKTTHFENAETGEPIVFEGVKGVSWSQGRGAAVLTVEFHSFELKAKGIEIPKYRESEEETSHRV